MKIASFRVRCANVAMREPHRTASGVIAASSPSLLSIESEVGVADEAAVERFLA